jgi:putative protease
VYAGLPDFSMRRRINAFDEKTLKEAIKYVHDKKKKIYVTINIYAHNVHIRSVVNHLKFLAKARPDAIILTDPGILALVKKYAPKIEVHLSTQANTTNWQAVKFWKEQGVKRVILAREVTLEEIKEIKKRVPKIELEYFVHGAMCMSYSGRCILSKWITGRSANLGDCVQPCRWKYKSVNENKKQIFSMSVEDDKEEVQIDLEEDANGTYFFNSRDLNLLEHLEELRKAGVSSFKIEGRNKSMNYVALVTRAYRNVLDALQQKVSKHQLAKIILVQKKELEFLANRGYTEGFLFGNEPEHNLKNSHVEIPFEFVGEAQGMEKCLVEIVAHNAIYPADILEAVTPAGNKPLKIKRILNDKFQEVVSAHGGQNRMFYLELKKAGALSKYDLIRKRLHA